MISATSSSDIPVKPGTTKRKHHFSLNVVNNEPVSKKAGRVMGSKTRTFFEKPLTQNKGTSTAVVWKGLVVRDRKLKIT